MIPLFSILLLCELALFVLAGYVFFRHRGHRIAEAVTAAVLATMMTLSFLFQTSFLLGRPALSILGETLLAAASAFALIRGHEALRELARRTGRFCAARPLLGTLLVVCGGYLAAAALLLPPDSSDGLRYHLPRVLLFQQERTLFLELNSLHQAPRVAFPVGSDILSHFWLRTGSDYGVAVFSFLSYLSIGFGTYALARRYAAGEASRIAALVVISLPSLVYQATSVKNDVVLAAIGVWSLLLVHRLLERVSAVDLLLLGFAILYGISVKILFLGFALPLVALFGFALWRHHGPAVWRAILVRHRWAFVAALVPALTVSQVWLFVRNYRDMGGWFGPPAFLESSRNHDGLWGAAANLVRYAHEVPDFLKVTDRLAHHATGHRLSEGPQWLYDTFFAPIFRGAGTTSEFRVTWSMHESKSWFGPLGFLLILPSVGYALRRGPPALKAVALCLVSYTGIVAWQVEWMQWNGRFFSICFAAGGVPAAWVLERQVRWRRWVGGGAAAILLYSLVFNQAKPIFPLISRVDVFFHDLVRRNIWVEAAAGRNRYYHFGDTRGLDEFAGRVPAGASVGIISSDVSSFYHFMIRRPDLRFLPLPRELLDDGMVDQEEAEGLDYLLCIGLGGCRELRTSPGESLRSCYTVDSKWRDFCLIRTSSAASR